MSLPARALRRQGAKGEEAETRGMCPSTAIDSGLPVLAGRWDCRTAPGLVVRQL